MYAIELVPSAARELADFDQATKRRVARRIDQLAEEPRGAGSLKLRGADDVWRARVGDYRLLYRIEDDRLLVLVIKIGHRRDVYR
ncbi:MAG: type II toxin-antitoxin system RelE family toxin [Candidatus Limnocylindria bacterium]